MKTILLCALLALSLGAQDNPVLVGGGAAFNQLGNPRTNLWVTAIYPVRGLFASTTTDIFPVRLHDPATNREYWGATTSLRQGLHRVVIQRPNSAVLLGGDLGVGIASAPSGLAYSVSGSATFTFVRHIRGDWSFIAPIRCLYINRGWNLVPQVGVVFRP